MRNARPTTKEKPSALNSANSTKPLRFTPRQRRVLVALLDAYGGWVTRERVDAIAGAANGPMIVRQLRLMVTGHKGIETRRSESRDRDGQPCRPGSYRLTGEGRRRALAALQRVEPQHGCRAAERQQRAHQASDWARVGAGLAVRFTLTGERLDAIWNPRPPTRQEWPHVIDGYRPARDRFLAEVAQASGREVLCLELLP
jgi:hypothetical protein